MTTRLAALALALFTTAATAQNHTPQLAHVLKQMDNASASFKSATADFRWEYYERVVRDTSVQTGNIYFERDGKSTTMGALVFGAPESNGKPKVDKIIEYKAGILQMFDTGVDQITTVKAGANQAQYEGFLTLGFGGSGSDLDRSWNINDLGPETFTDDGKPVQTEKLDLTSKTGDKNFTHITIWVDPVRGVSLKQIFYAPSGDYRTAIYSHIKSPGNLHKDHFAIKRDKNTTIVNR